VEIGYIRKIPRVMIALGFILYGRLVLLRQLLHRFIQQLGRPKRELFLFWFLSELKAGSSHPSGEEQMVFWGEESGVENGSGSVINAKKP